MSNLSPISSSIHKDSPTDTAWNATKQTQDLSNYDARATWSRFDEFCPCFCFDHIAIPLMSRKRSNIITKPGIPPSRTIILEEFPRTIHGISSWFAKVQCVFNSYWLRGKAKNSAFPQPWYRYNILMVLENGYQSLQEFDSFLQSSFCLFSLYIKYKLLYQIFDYFSTLKTKEGP